MFIAVLDEVAASANSNIEITFYFVVDKEEINL
jgi:hypothetical protein